MPGIGNNVVISFGTTVTLTQIHLAHDMTVFGTLRVVGSSGVKVRGNLEFHGEYIRDSEHQDEITFEGDKPQKILGSTKPVVSNLTVDKQKEDPNDPNEPTPTLETEVEIEVSNELTLENGLLKTREDATFNHVHIKQNAKLEGSPDKTKTYSGDKIVDGEYEANGSKDKFNGALDQQISGGAGVQAGLHYHELIIDKSNKPLPHPSADPEPSTAEFEKDLNVEEKTHLEKGNVKVHHAEFNGDVQIDEDGELLGTKDKKKIYYGDKTVDGTYTHNESVDEFAGSKEVQKISGETDRQVKIEYYELSIKKQPETQAEFEKELNVKEKTEVESGELKTKSAEFEGDVEIKQDAKLSGSEDSTQTFYKDKRVDGEFEHDQSKTEFKGDQEQTIDGSAEKQEKLEYDEVLIQKHEESQVEFEKDLKVEQKLTIEEGTLKTNTVFNEVVIEQNGTLILGDDDDPTEVQGNWTNDGEFESGNGTVVFNGTEPQLIEGSSKTTFNNLTIENETTLNAAIRIEGTLKLSSTLTLGEGGSIEFGEDFELEVDGDGGFVSTDPLVLEPIAVTPDGPVAISMDVNFSADFTNTGLTDEHAALWDWGDGNQSLVGNDDISFGAGNGTVEASYAWSEPGVYTVALTLTPNDDADRSDSAIYQFVVVYDPEGGFVTGGGWIDSPEGAYLPDPGLTGKANFGFVSRYQRGANVPTGNTQFQFKAGDLEFKSTEYEWLVVAGARAQFKGSGTINGEGDYGFMLVGIDGSVNGSGGENKFRIKIWDEPAGGDVVYDNQPGASDDSHDATVLGGGNIQIHQAQGSGNGQPGQR